MTRILFLSVLLIFAKASAQTSDLNLPPTPAQQQTQAMPINTLEIPTTPLINSSSLAKGPVKFKADIDGILAGRSLDDSFLKSTSGVTDLLMHLNAAYSQTFSFDFVLETLFVAGDTKSYFTDEGKSIQGLYLDEAVVNVTPGKYLKFQGGVIETAINPVMSAMSVMAFLGAVERVDYKIDSTDLTLSAFTEQSVPSSGTVTKSLVDDAPNAYFVLGTVSAELKAPKIKSIFTVAATAFEFGDLSSNVATDSQQLGNDLRSFEGIGPNTRFAVGFGGFESAASIQTDWTHKLGTKLVGSFIQNNEAPEDRNTGLLSNFEVTYKFESFNLVPSIGFFKVGADVIPAAYTWLLNRYNNRQGLAAGLKFDLEKEKLSFFGNYTKGDVIENTTSLTDRETYVIGVEAKYDIL